MLNLGFPKGQFWAPFYFSFLLMIYLKVSKFFIRLFADDTFLCTQNKDLLLLEREVNTELIKVYKWLASNKLTLNMDKSKCMIISKKKKTSTMSIRINGKELKHCDSYKYLGVYIDKDLSWRPHIDHICKKISKACGALAKTRHYVCDDTLSSIYYALINSYVRYGVVTWGNASADTLQPLHTLTSRALKIMSSSPFGRVDVKPIYEYFKVLDVYQTFTLESGKFVYKSKNALLPLSNIASHFTREVTNHGLGLRNRNNAVSVVPVDLLSSYEQKSIQHRAGKIWDEIPECVKDSEFFGSFKRKYKKHLLGTGTE